MTITYDVLNDMIRNGKIDTVVMGFAGAGYELSNPDSGYPDCHLFADLHAIHILTWAEGTALAIANPHSASQKNWKNLKTAQPHHQWMNISVSSDVEPFMRSVRNKLEEAGEIWQNIYI
uniref:DUF3085 domain-containing protein n=1 Tax=Meloidogyne hapla TaxID=6305 RepID=A0A1I8BCH2_MELHA